MYVDKETLLHKLPAYKDEWITITDSQSVHDIISEILSAHKEFSPYYDRIALYFKGDTLAQTCNNLRRFCKENISYREESEDEQTTALPSGILNRGYGDCKHYASFCGGILDALNRQGENIKWNYRFASYRLFNKIPHHVFIVVNDNNTDEEIWIDPTPEADRMMPYWYTDKKIKVSDMALHRNIAGIGDMQANDFVSVDIPKNTYMMWLRGQWYIVDPSKNKVGDLPGMITSDYNTQMTATAANATQPAGSGLLNTLTTAASAITPYASLIPVGLSVIQSISKLFGGSGQKAMQKIYQMFPLPPGATIGDVEQILDAVNQHWQAGDYESADGQWRDAYNSLVNSYAGILRTAGVTVKTFDASPGYNGVLIIYSNPENITAATSAQVVPTANPNSGSGALLTGGSNSTLLLLLLGGGLFLLSNKNKN